MSSLKPYKRAKNQPAWLFQYKNIRTGRWTQKILYCEEDQAKAYKKKFDTDYNYIKIHPEQIITNPADTTIKEVTIRFIRAKAASVSGSTIKRYQNVFDHFLSHFGPSSPISLIDSKEIQSFTLYYLQTHNKTGTNLALRHVKAFLHWCYDMEYIVRMPKIVMMKTEDNGIRWLTREEFNKIYEKAEPLIQDIMTICISTGSRINELLNCPWSKINLGEKIIILDPKMVKGRRREALYLNDSCIEVLERIKSTQNTRRKAPFPYTYSYIEHRYRKACQIAEIKSSMHDLRRSAGAWLLQDGVPIYQVSKFLRHSSVSVTERHYADLLKRDYQDLSDKIDQLKNINIKPLP